MDRLEWLEQVTSGITSNTRAREVRAELSLHISAVSAELVGQGLDAQAAEAGALRRMGEVEDLRERFRPDWQPGLSRRRVRLLVAGGLLAAFGTYVTLYSPYLANAEVVLLAIGALLIGASLLPSDSGRSPGMALVGALRRNRWVVVTWAILGLIAGLQAVGLGFAGGLNDWQGLLWPAAALLTIGVTAWATVHRLTRGSLRECLTTAYAGLSTYALVTVPATAITWPLWPKGQLVGGETWYRWTYLYPWYHVGLRTALIAHRFVPQYYVNTRLDHVGTSIAELALLVAIATLAVRFVLMLRTPITHDLGRRVWGGVRWFVQRGA